MKKVERQRKRQYECWEIISTYLVWLKVDHKREFVIIFSSFKVHRKLETSPLNSGWKYLLVLFGWSPVSLLSTKHVDRNKFSITFLPFHISFTPISFPLPKKVYRNILLDSSLLNDKIQGTQNAHIYFSLGYQTPSSHDLPKIIVHR